MEEGYRVLPTIEALRIVAQLSSDRSYTMRRMRTGQIRRKESKDFGRKSELNMEKEPCCHYLFERRSGVRTCLLLCCIVSAIYGAVISFCDEGNLRGYRFELILMIVTV